MTEGKENWYALMVCMFSETTVDKALIKMQLIKRQMSETHAEQLNMAKRQPKTSKETIEKILSLRRQGYELNDISRELDVSYTRVRYFCNKNM